MNQHAECPEGWPVTSHPSCASATAALDWGRQASFTDERRGYFSEYRYDALGRRVLVRTRRYGLCFASTANAGTVACTSGIERYVWAGDNILWELRGPGANTETAERLEQVDAVPQEYGIVGYTHAGGVDRPLVAYKTAGGNSGAVVVPHMNWRGLFSMGTNSVGGASTTPVEWPGFRTTANHSMGETQATTKNWMGSLLEGQRDAGGLMYMRNRYYDPQTGQFTQTDPIGIAGGLNTYGFAAGDPVSYADPYGLCPLPPALVLADGPQPGPADAAVAICWAGTGLIALTGWLVENRSRTRSETSSTTITATATSSGSARRRDGTTVRIQAQGGDVQESIVLSNPGGTVTAAEGLAALAALQASLSPSEQQARATSFARAARFIQNAPAGGGVVNPGKSFPAGPRTDVRVDIEVLRGQAFSQ